MTELYDDGGASRSGLSRELIEAGRGERASRAARLLATEALLSASAAAASAAPVGVWLTPIKWFGISLLALGSGDAIWRATQPRASNAPMTTAASPSSVPQAALPSSSVPSAVAEAPSRRDSASAPRELEPAMTSSVPSRPRAASPARARDAASAVAAASVPARDDQLRQELDALKAARQALEQGAPARALSVLHGKAGGFSRLPVEAGIVRIEALQRAGNRASARRLAQELWRDHGKGPYAERLKSLLGDGE